MGLAEEIEKAADKKEEIYSALATVEVLNATTVDVKTIKDDAEYNNVKLSPIGGDGILVRPKVDSTVIVTFLSKEKAFVTGIDQVEDIVFMGGALDGLVTVNELVTQLNALESDLNTLKSAVSGWTPVPNDGGAALKTALTAWFGATLTPTIKTDIENPKIKQ